MGAEAVTTEANTPGARLARARERLGWSVAQTGEKLHLDPRVVTALEADQFASLGAPVYVRGHLRRYAALVGESAADLESLYLLKQGTAGEPDVSQAATRSERALRPAPSIAPRALLVFAASLVLLALIVWAVRRSNAPDAGRSAPAADGGAPVAESQTAAPGAATGSSGGGAPAGGSAAGNGGANNGTVAGGGVVAVGSAAAAGGSAGAGGVSAIAPAGAATPAADSPPVPRRTRLALHFDQPVTVTVTDAGGKILLSGVMEAGAAPSLRGRAPFTLAFSNPAGVGLALDERTVFLTAGMRDTANLRVQLDAGGRLTQIQ